MYPFGLQIDERYELVMMLMKHNAVLCGSRFYGTHTEDSDYDYMVLGSKTLWDDMYQFDFARVSGRDGKKYEDDVFTVAVYTTTIGGEKIDIQVMKSRQALARKREIYELVRDARMFEGVSKDKQVHMFHSLLESFSKNWEEPHG